MDNIVVGLAEQLANAILKMLQMPQDTYTALRDRAHREARRFSWESVVETRLRYYQTLIQPG